MQFAWLPTMAKEFATNLWPSGIRIQTPGRPVDHTPVAMPVSAQHTVLTDRNYFGELSAWSPSVLHSIAQERRVPMHHAVTDFASAIVHLRSRCVQGSLHSNGVRIGVVESSVHALCVWMY